MEDSELCSSQQKSLVECFFALERSFSGKTIEEDRWLRPWLQRSEILFWLDIFHSLMPHVDIPYTQFQMRKSDYMTILKQAI